ncbi:MAG TPA: hypothetical protein VEI97_03665, partial [bacterium]|nr:hypothetical protein [bacterium]
AKILDENRVREAAFRNIAQVFNEEYGNKVLTPEQVTAWRQNYGNNKAQQVIEGATSSLGGAKTLADTFLYQYAATDPAEREAFIQEFVGANSVSPSAMNLDTAAQIKAKIGALPIDPGEKAFLYARLGILTMSKDQYVAEATKYLPGLPGGAFANPSSQAMDRTPPEAALYDQGSGIVTGPILQTAPHTYTNIARDVDGVAKPYMEKYDALYGLSRRVQSPPNNTPLQSPSSQAPLKSLQELEPFLNKTFEPPDDYTPLRAFVADPKNRAALAGVYSAAGGSVDEAARKSAANWVAKFGGDPLIVQGIIKEAMTGLTVTR